MFLIKCDPQVSLECTFHNYRCPSSPLVVLPTIDDDVVAAVLASLAAVVVASAAAVVAAAVSVAAAVVAAVSVAAAVDVFFLSALRHEPSKCA